jgi:hypothetical protein
MKASLRGNTPLLRAIDRVLDERGNHLAVGSRIGWPDFPDEIGPERVSNPGFKLLPGPFQRFIHVAPAFLSSLVINRLR